ncbi:MAG: molecular chaperone HtpG [Desulfomicrobium sp.]|nr:molecular chaperone HtpG [Pseudomonadota bacterium]MBV1710481.1 molecular chaperone HtpG [Desulfomicrobium sp.]MBU4570089.1 molecular chaperone HtpG [Pseudomonadota bacterium]MBU4593008.1 molecular chaperone HtpG [Pseudomonadota bacterium]MBV1720658.1 molecular chaperone HtpG [Desulfomicrobium sp.]
MSQAQQFEFKTEIKQLLDIITHSIYTSREIFLRELVSNASDALDKLRFEQSRSTEIASPDLDLQISITTDEEKRQLVIADTGIGMTMDELVENIGTIAHSGSAEFIRQAMADQANSSNIIGRFGVGFYSVFMVADKVTIRTRSLKPDSKAVEWNSDGLGTYTVVELEEDLPRGTTVTLELKEDGKEFAEKNRITSIIKKHSNFISFPILVQGEKANTVQALWRENKFSITPEQYTEFYKFLTYDHEEPLDSLHMNVDAPVQFSALAFVPPRSQDTFGFDRDNYGLDLYVRRVLIQSKNKDLIPEYLGFMRGVVDTEDLPLNISRETLQENLLIRKIATTLTKQILSHLKKLGQDKDRYTTFWKEHSKRFKLGYSDFANQEAFGELLRFNSSRHDNKDGLISLEEYIEAAKDGQKEIYYISGPSREAIEQNPHLEIFRAKGLEVLYLYEPVDEFVMDSLRKFKDCELKATENADIANIEKFADSGEKTDKPEDLSQEQSQDMDRFLKRVQQILGDRITEARISKRLSQSPSCLVSPDGSTSQMHKIMQLVTKDTSIPKKIFEINQDHKLVRNLLSVFGKNEQDEFVATIVEQLYESALLMDGYLADPHKMVNRLNKLMEDSSAWYKEREEK